MKKYSKIHFFSLSLMVSLSVFTTDLYLPSYPEMSLFFGISLPTLQWTQSVYLYGYAFFLLLSPLIVDMFGRKKVLIFGFIIYAIGTSLPLFFPNFTILLMARALQAIGGCFGGIISRALARETSENDKVTSRLSHFFTVMSIALISAPLLGGVCQHLWGWKSQFLVMLAYSLFLLVLTFAYVQESNEANQVNNKFTKKFLNDTKTVWKNKQFVYNSIIMSCLWSCFFLFITGSPIFLLEGCGIGSIQFGVLLSVALIGFIIGSIAAKWNVSLKGLGAATVAATGMMLLTYTLSSAWLFTSSAFLALMVIGILLSKAQGQAIIPLAKVSMAALSWLYLTKTAIAAIAINTFSKTINQSPHVLLIILSIFLLISFILFYLESFQKKSSATDHQ